MTERNNPAYAKSRSLPENSRFWSLVSTNAGDVDAPIIAKTPRALRSTVSHAVIDSELHELFKKPEWNQHLRSVIIAGNFAPEAHYRFFVS